MTPYEWFAFYAGRSTFSFTVDQPVGDQIVALVDAVRLWRKDRTDANASRILSALGELEAPE